MSWVNPITVIWFSAMFAIIATVIVSRRHHWLSAIRRATLKEILESDLAPGDYEVVSYRRVVRFVGYLVYDFSNTVTDGKKTWTVLSTRPLPKNLHIIRRKAAA